MKNLKILILMLLVGGMGSWQLIGQTEVSGKSYFFPNPSTLMETANNTQVITVSYSGFSETDDPNSPFNFSSIECQGKILEAQDKSSYGCNLCHVTDKDGDTFMYFASLGDEGQTQVDLIGGTGKFKNISGSGSSENLGASSDGKFVHRWTMKYSLE